MYLEQKEYRELENEHGILFMSVLFNGINGYREVRKDSTYQQIKESINSLML